MNLQLFFLLEHHAICKSGNSVPFSHFLGGSECYFHVEFAKVYIYEKLIVEDKTIYFLKETIQ